MQTAPFAPTPHDNPQPIRLVDITPGQAFVTLDERDAIYALLSHRGIDVTDSTRRWCVVLAARDDSTHHLGELVPMTADAGVYRIALCHPAIYSVA